MHQINGVRDPATSFPLAAAIEVAGVQHVQARARWTGRTLRVEVEGFLDAATPLSTADQIGRSVAAILTTRIPAMQSFTWSARAA